MSDVLTIKLNDTAAEMLGVTGGPADLEPPGGLAAGLRERLDRGIVRRGPVLTWADSVGAAEDAPSIFTELTHWECADSSFHIEDSVPVDIAIVDDAPMIAAADQRTLLLHGLAFGLRFGRLVRALDPAGPVRCVIGVNDTNATFRFHQIRPGEHWNRPELDSYRLDRMIVLDIEPDPGVRA